jgi:hypothetical protein
VVQALHASLLEFQTVFNQNTALHGYLLNAMPIWDEGIVAWGLRMDFFIRNWVLIRISQLRGVWANVRATTQDSTLYDHATYMLEQLDDLEIQADNAGVNLPSFEH